MCSDETALNFETRVNEHNNINKQSKPAKHVKLSPDHAFAWDVLTRAQSWLKRRIIEVFCVASLHPELSKQVELIQLIFFHGNRIVPSNLLYKNFGFYSSFKL